MNDTFSEVLIVSRGVDEVYSSWLDFEDFPQFMDNILSVTKKDEETSHWTVRGPLGTEINWDAEVTMLEPSQRIGWKAKGEEVQVSGQVVFTPLSDSQTQITVTMKVVPSGVVRALAAPVFGNVEGKVKEDLYNFKNHLEGRAA